MGRNAGVLLLCLSAWVSTLAVQPDGPLPDGRYLYVAVPGIRNYLEYGGHGLLIFDIDHDHRFVRRIRTEGKDEAGKPLNVKGICASAQTGRLYISTLRHLQCLDLLTGRFLWQREYVGGCDRMAISPDGRTIYLPSLEGPHWHVVDATTGEVLKTLVTNSGAHNTIYGPSGRRVYLAGLKSPWLFVADTSNHEIIEKVGPFSAAIRPFTIDASERYVFVNVNDLLGFEVGDLLSGKMLFRVEVQGFKRGPVKRHGCPSHGIGLTPDGRQLWLTDAANSRMHIFDATVMPPRQKASIELRDQPGWITFSPDGQFAYPSTGDVIDAASMKVTAHLTDETGAAVQSEKMIYVRWQSGKPVEVGDQFGIGGTVKHE